MGVSNMQDGNKITLTIKYVAGDYTDDFNVHQTVGHVLTKAVTKLKIDESVASKLGLYLDGNLLANSTTISEAGLQDNTLLKLSSLKNTDIEG